MVLLLGYSEYLSSQLGPRNSAENEARSDKSQSVFETDLRARLVLLQAILGVSLGDASDSDDDQNGFSDLGSEWGPEDIEVSPEDEAAVAAFLNPNVGRQRTLADIILEKIREKESRDARAGEG